MRIRLTLDIERHRKDDGPEAPDIYDLSSGQVEHAGPQRMGFTAPMPSNDYEEDE